MKAKDKADSLVIAKVRQGDIEAFGKVVDKYQPILYQLAYKILLNREDALDSVQDAFVLAYRALEQYDIERPFYLWLYKIAYNAAIKTYNRRKVTKNMLHLDDLENPENLIVSKDNPTTNLLSEEIQAVVKQGVAKLSPDYRAVFVLRVQEELSYKDIASILSIPIGTVMSRLARAREQLQNFLTPILK